MRIKKIWRKILVSVIILTTLTYILLSNQSDPFDRGRNYLPSIENHDDSDESSIYQSSIVPIRCVFTKYRSFDENHTCGYDVDSEKLFFPEEFIKQISDVSFNVREEIIDDETSETVAKFQVSYSDPDKYIPDLPYDLGGLVGFSNKESDNRKLTSDSYFLNFAAYQVELRDRVKCMDNTRALPVTTQWDKNGYFYPTQIAQFALSHFSRFTTVNPVLVNKQNIQSVSFDLDKITEKHSLPYIMNLNEQQQKLQNNQISTLKKFNITTNSLIINFLVPSTLNEQSRKTCHYSPEKPQKSSITIEINTINPAVQIYITYNVVRCINLSKFNKCSGRVFRKSRTKINLDADDLDPTGKSEQEPIVTVEIVIPVYIPPEETNSDFLIHSRNVYADAIKALLHYTKELPDLKIDIFGTAKTMKMSKVKLRFDKLVSVRISDVCAENMFNFELKESSELEFFWNAVDFLKNEYDEFGGYPNTVKRKIDGYDSLDKGWYGSMVQGQSMSVLARAYFLEKSSASADSSNDEYFQALLDLMQPFKIDSKDHGVRNYIFGKYVWYEMV